MEKMTDFIPMDDVMAGMASNHDGDIFIDQNMSHIFDDTNPIRLAEEVSLIGSTQYNMGQRNRILQSWGNNNTMAPSQNRGSPMDQLGNGQHEVDQSWNVQHQMGQSWSVQNQMGHSWNSRRQPDQSGSSRNHMSQPHVAPSLMGFDWGGGSSQIPPLHPEFMPGRREQAPDRTPRPKSGRKRQQHANK
ncbi:uncharacterized protein LOC119570535 [Penaeus monodon]|uniref:uncharacterized protein LOC119570535 n=1 Tax=Penaeus monodon TaxID=6687 RepID=UPI0018A75C24|nr:uncharacterized protein LOC119570535 [Penaeus monodon]